MSKQNNNNLKRGGNPQQRQRIMKTQLALQYIELKKQFDGEDFKKGIKAHNVEWLVKEFKVIDLKDKINAVKSALAARNK